MHFARITVVLPLFMLLVGCSNGGDKPVPQIADGVSGDSRDSSSPDGSDLFELWSEAGTVFDAFRSADAVAPGEPGYPCADFDDCLSGWCVTTSDGKKCSMECLDECPFGWSCTLHKPSLPDEIYICAPTMMNLCKPCNANADCATNGVDVGDACVPLGDQGSFCGGSCDTGSCPMKYECAQVEDVHGGLSQQCLLISGQCTCSEWSVDEAASTACYFQNEWGTCPGQRQCSAAGLTPCSAVVPAPETCNGQDDDCDGAVDEGDDWGTCLVANAFGSCTGAYECGNGVLKCIGDEPQPELCDGLDNDCDGKTDEGFPDADGDMLADCIDEDDDNDGLADTADNCPTDVNVEQENMDDDAYGDVCDPEKDGDGLANVVDNCPDTPNPTQSNVDGDEFGDACDTDIDNDGHLNADDNCPLNASELQLDFDGDGDGDICDIDDDNDGDPDVLDCLPLDPAVSHVAPELCNGKDDNCNVGVDEGFPDSDFDGFKDCVDTDDDNDGEADPTDCEPLIPQIHHGMPEQCNGIDDDCDGEVDDGFGLLKCGLGVCYKEVPACVDGEYQFCNPYDQAVPEVCDGMDNNCNGLVDDGFSINQPCVSGFALCAVEGTIQCLADGSGSGCDAVSLEPDCGQAECGDDGCGGVCGDCPEVNSVCHLGKCECYPDCFLSNCGLDGCGGNCGECPASEGCNDGVCSGCDDGNTASWDGCTNGIISEFRVNDTVVGTQSEATVQALKDGRFVVVWSTDGYQETGWSIVYKFFSADGLEEGPEVLLDPHGEAAWPDSAVLKNGNIVIVWSRGKTNNVMWMDIFCRIVAPDGLPVSDIFPVNSSFYPVLQRAPDVAALSNGSFAVVWHSVDGLGNSNGGDNGISDGVSGTIFDETGQNTTPEFVVNTYTKGDQENPWIAALPQGRFAAVWESNGQDGTGWGIFGQVLDSDGDKFGAEFQVHGWPGGWQVDPRVFHLGGDRLLTMWDGAGADGSDTHARIFSADGTVLKDEFALNTSEAKDNDPGAAAALPDGGYVALWESLGQGNPWGNRVAGQRYNADDEPVGPDFIVHTNNTYGRYEPSVSVFADGGYVVVWESVGQDGNSSGVYAQRFNADGIKVYH